MRDFKETLLLIDRGNLTDSHKVQIIELLLQNIEGGSIQDVSNLTGVSYNGVKGSSRFKKIEYGSLKIAFAEVESDNLPVK